MEKQIIDAITAYTDRLRLKEKLQISFCDISTYFASYMHVLYPYNYHRNCFCEYVKSDENAAHICVAKQKNVMEKCKGGVFFGTCWAGMAEYVFPIHHKETVLGFLSVSGYREDSGKALEKIRFACKKCRLDEKTAIKAYLDGTSETIPPLAEIKTLVEPLCIMFERLYIEYENGAKNGRPFSEKLTLYERILDYVCNHYTSEITVEQIAEYLNYSPSYIGKLFYKNSKRHLTDYVLELRLKRSVELLSDSVFSVGEIANAVGFQDANYFSTVFKKHFGDSPNKYRKRIQNR